MKSLSGIPSFESSFSKHRSNCSSHKRALDISLLNTTSAPNWAPLPSPPMSGSPPPEDPPEPPQVAGRRRKRSTTPPTAAAADAQTPTEPASSARRAAPRREEAELATTVLTAPSFPTSYPSAPSLGHGPPGLARLGSTTTTTTTALEPPLGPADISPRATRKTKAHVASACVNCKKKHLRCDNARPCRRCVQSGKEASCIDVEHKKRGRPPLKPEESQPRRPFDSAMSPLQGQLAAFNRLPAPHPSSYAGPPPPRDLRPVPSGSDGGRPVFPRPAGPYQTIYAQPTVSPSPATAVGTMSRHVHAGLAGHSQAPAQTPYAMTQSGGMNALGPENFSHYAGSYSYASSQAPAPYSLFPRTSAQMPASLHSTSRPSYGHMSTMPPDLRLPPIQPAPPGGAIDPAMAQQQRHAQQQSPAEPQGGNGTTRQPDPKRPKISDILRDD